MTKTLTAALVAVLVLMLAVAPAAAAGPGDQVDDCMNSDAGPSGDAGPPGFVAGLVPDFISGLMADLPVPGFVKGFFGVESSC